MMMQPRRAVPYVTRGSIVLLAAMLSGDLKSRAVAEEIDSFLPPIVSGAGTAPGVTVPSRLRPEYDAANVRLGDWLLSPTLTETGGYNSDVTGFTDGRASAFSRTFAAANLTGQWTDGQVAAGFTVDDLRYFEQPAQSYTDWTASVGGSHILGAGTLTLAYSHLDLHEAPSDFGALQADTPVGYRIEDAQVFYTVPVGRMTVTPMLDVRHFTFDSATLVGVPVDLGYLDRDVISADVTVSYPLSEQRSIVVVGQAIENSYEGRQEGQPTETSHSGRVLVGLDEAGIGPWRYRALAGLEVRAFAAAQYPTRAAAILEGSVTWTPDGQSDVTLSLTRTIEDPTDEGVAGYVDTKATLVADRELRRDLLLQVSAGVQNADYLEGNISQTNALFGISLTKLLNRNARLIASYSFNDQRGADQVLTAGGGAPSVLRGGNYKRHLVSVAVKVGL